MAMKLVAYASENGFDLEDVWLIAAAASRITNRQHLLGVIKRLQQVCEWLLSSYAVDQPLAPHKSRERLKNQANELSRQLANGIFADQGFLLLIFDIGLPNDLYLSHAASISKEDQARILRLYLERLPRPPTPDCATCGSPCQALDGHQ